MNRRGFIGAIVGVAAGAVTLPALKPYEKKDYVTASWGNYQDALPVITPEMMRLLERRMVDADRSLNSAIARGLFS